MRYSNCISTGCPTALWKYVTQHRRGSFRSTTLPALWSAGESNERSRNKGYDGLPGQESQQQGRKPDRNYVSEGGSERG